MPPIAPVLKELEDCACTEVDASGEVTIVVATGMVIDVPEEGVELVPNGLWSTPPMVVVRTDFLYPVWMAQPKPVDEEAYR